MVLVPIAAIVYGCALILDSGVNNRLTALEARKNGVHGLSETVARESATAAANIQMPNEIISRRAWLRPK